MNAGGDEALVDLALVAASLVEAGADVDSVVPAPAFAGAALHVVADADLRVTHPWRGPVFDLVARAAAAAPQGSRPRLGLLVPVVWTGSDRPPDLVVVSDHVDLALRGPLAGRRPDGGPQTFPSLNGIYQPLATAPAADGRVYSEVAVAGVADAGRLTPFERREISRSGCSAYCDCLVDAVVVAAFHGVEVVACGVPRRETQH